MFGRKDYQEAKIELMRQEIVSLNERLTHLERIVMTTVKHVDATEIMRHGDHSRTLLHELQKQGFLPS
jgi:hypothetical protein